MDGITFRPFEERDLDWVLAAMVESHQATLTPERAAASEPEALLRDARADFDRFHYQAKKPEHALLAWLGDRRVGFVWVTIQMPVHEDESSAWLLEVYVVPDLRRRGLARDLMSLAEGWARSQGAKDLWLNVGGGNDKALALYEARGFRVETMHLSKKLG